MRSEDKSEILAELSFGSLPMVGSFEILTLMRVFWYLATLQNHCPVSLTYRNVSFHALLVIYHIPVHATRYTHVATVGVHTVSLDILSQKRTN